MSSYYSTVLPEETWISSELNCNDQIPTPKQHSLVLEVLHPHKIILVILYHSPLLEVTFTIILKQKQNRQTSIVQPEMGNVFTVMYSMAHRVVF